jgi:hypothetical protein
LAGDRVGEREEDLGPYETNLMGFETTSMLP